VKLAVLVVEARAAVDARVGGLVLDGGWVAQDVVVVGARLWVSAPRVVGCGEGCVVDRRVVWPAD